MTKKMLTSLLNQVDSPESRHETLVQLKKELDNLFDRAASYRRAAVTSRECRHWDRYWELCDREERVLQQAEKIQEAYYVLLSKEEEDTDGGC